MCKYFSRFFCTHGFKATEPFSSVNNSMLDGYNQYCIYTRDFDKCLGLFKEFATHDINYEAHINRTRFWINPYNALHLLFLLKYSHYVVCVDHESDHATGT
jgi:hypothetical protein